MCDLVEGYLAILIEEFAALRRARRLTGPWPQQEL
jgi:hypothetical protein